MTIPLDVITRKKLILVRQIYQRAVIQSEVLHSDFDRIMSLIAFDLASETVLKAVVGALEPSKNTDKDFQSIIQQADALFVKQSFPEVPDKPKIQHVHSLRNDAQHKAKYPSNTDVSDSRTYTRDFLQQIVLNVWGQDFNTISLTEVIRHTRVKEFLEQAEQEIKNSNTVQAVARAKAGFQLAMGKVKHSVVGRYADSMSDHITVKKISNAVFLSVVGLDYPSYLRYKKLSRMIHVFDYGDHIQINTGSDDPITTEDAEYIVNYAVNSVIQIESLVGDIEKPFEL
jgi:hypothetical protein